jgi:hypothetical protein
MTGEKRLYDWLGSFPRGINSSIDPILLPKEQLAFLSNGTNRGDFITQRPNFFNLTLKGTSGDLSDFQTGLFQGASYYRTTVNGYIMIAMNGKLFQISIGTGGVNNGTATVTEIVVQAQIIPSGERYSSTGLYSIVLRPNTAYSLVLHTNDTGWSWSGATGSFTAGNLSIPSSNSNGVLFLQGTSNAAVSATLTDLTQNTTNTVQNWLWQAEQFLIWNDGVTLPLIYDGASVFRSLGSNPAQLASLTAGFVVPAIGEFAAIGSPATNINIPINSAWPLGLGTVMIGSALYYVQSFTGGLVGGLVTLGLSSVLAPAASFPSGTTIAVGTHFQSNNKLCGIITNAQLVSNTDSSLSTATNYPAIPVAGLPGVAVTLKVLSDTGGLTDSVSGGTAIYGNRYYAGQITAATMAGSSISNWPAMPAAEIDYLITVGLNGNANGGAGRSCGFYRNYGYIASGLCTSAGNGTATVKISSGGGNSCTLPCGLVFFPVGSFGTFDITSFSLGTFPTPTPAAPNWFTLTLTETFQGTASLDGNGNASGDILQVGAATMRVGTASEMTVTCQMTNNSTGTTIPLNTTVVIDNAYASPTVGNSTNFGSTVSAVAMVAVGGTMVLPMPQGTTFPVSGQTVYFTTTNGNTVVAEMASVASGNTYGAVPNYFILTLSVPFTGSVVGHSLQTGSTGTSTLAQFTVVPSTVGTLATNQVQCQMTNSYTGLIPKTPTWTTDKIVIDNTANGTLTNIGSYVSGSVSVSCTIVTGQDSSSPTQLEVIQVQTSAGVILFLVSSISGASVSASPSLTLSNVNDTAGNTVAAGTVIYSLPQLPVGKMGAYGMGRNWVSLPDGVSYVASDMVGSSTGSVEYNFTDAVLFVSQNYLLAGGGTFKISGSGESIMAMSFVAQLDAALGQGPLQVLTDETVFSNLAPTNMTTWSAMTSPIQVEGLIGSGAVGQDAVIQQNNDLIFRMSNGGVQSMLMATLDFNQWGNTPISKEITRSIVNDNPALLPFCSMVTFNNRMLMTCQFVQATRGVYGAAMASLNFDSISSLAGKSPTVWEGEWTGLNVLQLVSGTFNKSKQCFAICLSADLTQIELHQIQLDGVATLDNGAQPVAWFAESSMLFKDPKGKPRSYKRLINGEFSINKIQSNVGYQWYYRSDENPTWTPWYSGTVVYQGASDTGFRSRVPIGMPNPKLFDAANNRPLREGYNFQTKFVFTGYCEFVGARFGADMIDEPEFGKPT